MQDRTLCAAATGGTAFGRPVEAAGGASEQRLGGCRPSLSRAQEGGPAADVSEHRF